MKRTVKDVLKVKGFEVWSVSPQTSVFDAIRLMSDRYIGAVLVMEGPVLAGIVSERDYLRKVILEGRSSRETTVAQIMTREVVSVDPQRSVEDCMSLMTQRKIRHLPVRQLGRVIGIISIGDVVRSLVDERGVVIDQLERYIMGL